MNKVMRFVLGSIAALGLAASLAPALASAQYVGSANCGINYFQYNNQTCTPGTLLVYMQVTNQFGTNRQPLDFTVTVSAQNPSPASFPGSQSGTQVTLAGGYSVQALQLPGFVANYSTGCTGSLINNQQATCVITESSSQAYYPSPTPYPYQYLPNPALTCQPSYQTVGLGQSITFQAQGGSFSQYNWQTPQRAYLNIGPTLNTVFSQTGTQNITVTNGTETATCTVNVVAGQVNLPPPPPSYINPTTPYAPGAPYVTPTYVPALPNTGIEPATGAEMAFAAVALIALAMVSFPYVRKAFAVVLG